MIRKPRKIPTSSLLSDCPGNGDIVFVLDSSGSVGGENFELVKDFVIFTIEALDIESGAYRIGISSFSDSARIEFNLNAYNNRPDLEAAIKRIPYVYGSTNTAAALNQVRYTMLTPSYGDRPGNCYDLLYQIRCGKTRYIKYAN